MVYRKYFSKFLVHENNANCKRRVPVIIFLIFPRGNFNPRTSGNVALSWKHISRLIFWAVASYPSAPVLGGPTHGTGARGARPLHQTNQTFFFIKKLFENKINNQFTYIFWDNFNVGCVCFIDSKYFQKSRTDVCYKGMKNWSFLTVTGNIYFHMSEIIFCTKKQPYQFSKHNLTHNFYRYSILINIYCNLLKKITILYFYFLDIILYFY